MGFWRREVPAEPAPSWSTAARECESLLLPYSVEHVWSLIKPAENGKLTDPDVMLGFRIPGTPDGTGEQQCFLHRDGTYSVLEVLHEIPFQQAVTRTLLPTPDSTTRTFHSVQEQPTGCLLTLAVEMYLPAGMRWNPLARAHWERHTRGYLGRVADVLDRGWAPAGLVEPTSGRHAAPP
ncbi:hypothetical protein GCM10027047_35630 [Rhodococcus aerolatus]